MLNHQLINSLYVVTQITMTNIRQSSQPPQACRPCPVAHKPRGDARHSDGFRSLLRRMLEKTPAKRPGAVEWSWGWLILWTPLVILNDADIRKTRVY